MSRGPDYAQFSYPQKDQHLHTSAAHHHQYAQQPNSYATSQGALIAQVTSGTPNTQYVDPQVQAQARRYTAPLTLAISRQYNSTPHSSIAPLAEHTPSPSQCPPTNNNVAPISSSTSSYLPASSPTHPPIVPAGLSSPNSGNVAATSASDLHVILAQFGSQSDLLKSDILKLILISKVEEDKRKTAEAYLRAKELDLMSCECYKRRKITDHVDEQKNEETHSNQDIYENDSSIGMYSATDGTVNNASFCNNLSSSPPSTPISQSTPRAKQASMYLKDQGTGTYDECTIIGMPKKRKRTRRETQPVTKVTKTKERTHDDGHLWKNNGNTIQKKTGNKSVYYKCSTKGCPVNKTVAEQDDGWIMIKYRGHHSNDCGKIEWTKI